ncbi:MAG TPA: cytochrome c peroxidase [Candidatus Eisenbacteria bacterium]|jgi:cytochrome c peroxidase
MRRFIPAFAIAILALELASVVGASGGGDTRRIAVARSLKGVPVPMPSNLADFVKNKAAAIALGKSLFWDMQVGGDGRQACASCHFQAGADVRSVNQLNPGHNGAFDVGGPNHTLTAADYPFHQLANPSDPKSAVTNDRDDVGGSQGVHNALFQDIIPGARRDQILPQADPNGFSVGGLNVRRVTGRNTPSVVNAVFNVRNFWDGRANNIFNGRNPFGNADAAARVLVMNDLGECVQTRIALDNASLASQAVGPPNNGTEMSANGRDWLKLGKKMLSLRPLDGQKVMGDDSVLGAMAVSGGTGLATTYADMVRAAFQDKWWNSTAVVDGALAVIPGVSSVGALSTSQYSMMEANFSLFWGLAINLYESTLVSDDSPFDRFLDGNKNALTASQQSGLGTFNSKCASCHSGAELSSATFSATATAGLITTMQMADGGTATYDRGFYNIGVRPTGDDVGVGGTDPFGNPLSISRRTQTSATARVAVDGAFKVPSLRNVELTGPYFHNGSAATLQQVVEFYSRGGNFASTNIANLDPNIQEIGKLQNNSTNQRQVVDFLTSLTDDRVRFQRAPFDHPQLILNQGAPGGELSLLADLNIAGQAADATIELAATGAGGSASPVASFLGIATAPTTFTAALTAGDGTLGTPVTDGGADFALSLPSPNPVGARSGSTIHFSLSEAGNVDMQVFDVTGRAVKTLAKGTLNAGAHSIQWSGISDAGTRLPAGVYMYRLQAGRNVAQRKLILVN